jgi:hypothetical protein
VSGLFESGRAVDLLLLLMAAEAGLLWAYARRTCRGLRGLGLAANLAAGACLLLALRAALTDGGWELISLCLLGGLIAHLADLRNRLRP